MDFLLDPNVAYLFLIGGVFLAMLALASPGTGVIEIAAFFCILLAGYAVYNLSFHWWALLLLALSIVPFVYALRKPKRELFLAFAILLLILGSVFMFQRAADGNTVNPLLAIMTSAFVAGFLWVAVRKSVEAASVRPLHDPDGLVGRLGEARTKIEDEGSVFVAGELWSAKSDKAIAAGSPVRVVRRDGFVLIVEKNS
ncbi:MAG TPA: NfeD family protein [Anaerolineales bacterium]|nr:NfeD family protein [Anaerolineales bacterium]